MNKTYVSLAAGSVIRVCCDRFEGSDCSGRFYTRYAEEPVDFRNAGELLNRMDQFYDWLGYPQPSIESRRFQRQFSEKHTQGEPALEKRKIMAREGEKAAVVKEDDMNRHQGEKATFVVRIQYRQNASWQGQVTWAEKNQTVPFRSALELLKLIDSTEASPEESWNQNEERI